MTVKEFKTIARILKQVFKELEVEALKNGIDLLSPEYDKLVSMAREKVLKDNGFTLDEYREVKESYTGVSREAALEAVQSAKKFMKDVRQEIDDLKSIYVPSEADIEDIAARVAAKHIKAPQIINKIVKEVHKPKIINRNVKETIKVKYDDSALTKDIKELRRSLYDVQQIKPIDESKLREDLKGYFSQTLQENINMLGMPDFRKLAMGLQAQIDELSASGGSGGGHIIEDEGTPVTQRATLNFTGSGVTVTDSGGKTVVDITSGGGTAAGNLGEIQYSDGSGTFLAIPLAIAEYQTDQLYLAMSTLHYFKDNHSNAFRFIGDLLTGTREITVQDQNGTMALIGGVNNVSEFINDAGYLTSPGIPTAITVANEATDTTCFPLFVTAATGDLGPKTNAGLTFNSNTGVFGATGFSGPLTGNVTGNLTGTASVASTVTVVNSGGDTTSFILIADSDTGNLAVKSDPGLRWNATSNILETDGPLIIDGNFRLQTNDSGQLGSATISWSDLFLASGAVINFNNGNATLTHSAGLLTSNVDIVVPDEAYGVGWNGSTEVPTKNALYDKIETLGGSGATTALDNLASVAINTTLVSDTDNTDDLGTSSIFWRTGYFKTSIELGSTDTTLTRSAAGMVAVEGVDVATVSATQTLSNKTLTAPKFADLGFIADANGNELLIFDTVTSAVNELTYKNNATGSNPTFTSTGDDTNIGVTFTPKGTGNFVFNTASSGYYVLNSNATGRSWRTGGIYDGSGNIIVGTTVLSSAVNYVNIQNAGTGANPTISSLGSDSNVGIDFQAKGTGVYRFLATASGPTDIRLFEDTDNGTNYVSLIAPATLAGDVVLTLPSTTGTVALLGGNVFTGVQDAGGATSFEIPNGVGGTMVDATGEVTIDSTSKTLNFYDGAVEAVLTPIQSKSITIESPGAAEDVSMFYTDDAITITKMVFVITGSTSATTTIRHHTDRSNAGNEVVTGGTTANSTTTGNVVTSFNDATVPADSFIWLETTALSGTPTSLNVTIFYRQDA